MAGRLHFSSKKRLPPQKTLSLTLKSLYHAKKFRLKMEGGDPSGKFDKDRLIFISLREFVMGTTILGMTGCLNENPADRCRFGGEKRPSFGRAGHDISIRRASVAIEALEERRLLSGGGTLSPLAEFDGTNGAQPHDVVADASGNLFGVTQRSVVGGQETGPGGVFEIPAGTTTIKVLATFSNGDGGESLVIDSNGNLYGSTEGGNLFEVIAGTSTITPLAQPGLVTVTAVDSAGDLFGTAGAAGPFELVHGSSSITLLAPSGASPDAIDATDVIVAPNGTVYGTAYVDDGTDGSIFEIPAGTTNFQTVASFNAATTGSFPIGIALDANGNVFGVCENGGANGDGTVFELPSGSSTISLIASFNSATGEMPISRPVLNSSGDLYGVTENGGASGFGTVFGIATSGGSGIEDLADLGSNIVVGQDQAGLVTNAANQPFISPSATAAAISASVATGGSVYTPTEVDSAINHAAWYFATGGTLHDADGSPSPDDYGIIDLMNFARQTIPWGIFVSGNVPPSVVAGGGSNLNAHLKVLLKNDGTSAVKGSSEKIQLYLSPDGLLSDATAVSAAITKKVSLKVSQSESVPVTIKSLPTSLPAGTYQLVAAVTDSSGTSTATGSSVTVAAPFVSLSGTVASVPGSVKPGKKVSVGISVANAGNIAASGTLEIALSARPSGTTGSADLSLPTVGVKIKIKPSRSGKERLSFVIPSAFPAGTYSLVLQLDPNNAFNESNLPSLIVSAGQFTVS